MHDALLVRGVHSRGDLDRDVDRLIDGKRAALEHLLEILALDELHREEPRVARPVQAVDGGDVRVVQSRERLCLTLETRQPVVVVGEGLRQDLDGHVTIERRVLCTPHRTHPALAYLLGEGVVQQTRAGLQRHAGKSKPSRDTQEFRDSHASFCSASDAFTIALSYPLE